MPHQGGNVVVISIFAVTAMIGAMLWFDFPGWIILAMGVFSGGLYAQRVKASTNFILSAGHFASGVAVIAFAFPLWIPLTASVLGVALIVKRFWGF